MIDYLNHVKMRPQKVDCKIIHILKTAPLI